MVPSVCIKVGSHCELYKRVASPFTLKIKNSLLRELKRHLISKVRWNTNMREKQRQKKYEKYGLITLNWQLLSAKNKLKQTLQQKENFLPFLLCPRCIKETKRRRKSTSSPRLFPQKMGGKSPGYEVEGGSVNRDRFHAKLHTEPKRG